MKLLVALFSSAVLAAGFSSSSNAAEKHLVYMHGCCVKQTNGAIAKDFKTIAQKLRDAGFNVLFELRTSDQTDSDAYQPAGLVGSLRFFVASAATHLAR